VTADTIKLGVLPLTLAGLEGTPFYEGFRKDAPEYAAALAAHQNARGGILGRKIVTVARKTDPLTRDDQIQACTFLARDQQVFAAIDPTSSLIYADARRCLTHQNATPLIHGYAESYAVQAQVPGYDVALFPVYDRVAEDWVDAAKTLGVLKPGMKVGLLGDRCQPANETAHRVLEPAVRKAGGGSLVFGEHDCTLDGLSQVPNIVTQFKLAGVELVLPFGNAGTQQVFQQGAKNQQYKPVYFESDWYNNASNAQTRTYDEEQFEGTKGVTVNYNADAADSPLLRRCSQVATDAGLPAVTREPHDAELVALCDAFFLFVRAAEIAGTNLTRQGWAQAIQQVGEVEAALMPHMSFGRGKFDGGDMLRYVEWRRSCKCYQAISPYKRSVTLR
jgi:ABC-type branched-subunit amino acid transport system substrate-binding protein